MYPQRLPTVDGDDGVWGDILRKYLEKEHFNDNTDNAANGGHKNVTIRAGTAGAGGAPLKFTSGTLLTTPEIGAIEFAGDYLYITQNQSSVTTRKKILAFDYTTEATGDMYYRNASGYFTRLAAGTASQILTISGGLPSWQNPSSGSGTFSDTTFTLQDNADATKQTRFELSGITTGTTRTITVPNSNGTMYVTGGTDVSVADGGTGRSTSTTAYGIIAAGTSATSAQQTISPGTAGQFLKSAGASALASFTTLTPTDVGLGNVNNTSDANKPVSTATQTTINNLTLDNLKRVTKQGYNPAGSDTYYRLANFPIDDSGNWASILITGRLGGWVNTNMASWNILLANRSDAGDGVTIKASVSGIGNIWPALGCCDLVVYAQPDKSAILYIRVPSDQYFVYDLSYTSIQATPAYTGIAETPTGVDVWHIWQEESIAPVSQTNEIGQLYGTDWDTGEETTITYENEAYAETIAERYTGGRLRVGTPVEPADATTKAYVDNIADSISYPYDMSIIAFGTYTARVANSYGDFPMGTKLQRAATFDRVVYRVNTADASGNLVVQLRKNGTTVSGTSVTIAAANQVAGGTATGSWAFAEGDILTVYVTGVGTNPGAGLIADIRGWTS